MYLSSKINRALQHLSLDGRQTHRDIVDQCRNVLKPFGARVDVTYSDALHGYEYTISGTYNSERIRQPIHIWLHFSMEHGGNYQWTRKRGKQFRFSLSQVLQHEWVHKCQHQYRDGVMGYRGQQLDYLANKDEIGAYAHDLCMELEYYYGSESFDVLRKVGRSENLTSYEIYEKAFRGCEWSKIKKRLLKQTFKWMEKA